MTKYHVKLKGLPKEIVIEADVTEESLSETEPLSRDRIFKASDEKIIAQFGAREIAGWWIEPEDVDLAKTIRAARERAHRNEV